MATKKPKLTRWSNVTGEIFVFAKTFNKGKKSERTAFSCSISRNVEGKKDEYEQYYIPVRFVKDAHDAVEKRDPETPLHAVINDAFITFDRYTNKAGETVTTPVLVIMDYDEFDE